MVLDSLTLNTHFHMHIPSRDALHPTLLGSTAWYPMGVRLLS